MPLFASLNDEFESHTAQPLNSTTYVPGHYDIRSFNGTDLTAPRTMPDFRYWNASNFNGTSMITLSTPRSIVGRSISARTMAEVDLESQALLDAQTIQQIELYTLSSGDEGWPVDVNIIVGKDSSLRYANTIAVNLTGGVSKTVASSYRDNILTDFGKDLTYFGSASQGTLPEIIASDYVQVSQYTSREFGSASSIDLYLDGNGNTVGPQTINAVLYADSAGAPGALLAVSNPVDIQAGQNPGWVNFPLASTVDLPRAQYWIGIFAGPNNVAARFYANSIFPSRIYKFAIYGSGAPNPMGAGTTTDNLQISARVNYTPSYFIELALPNFPAQAAGTHLDIANSFIDFSSDASFAGGQTDSFRFNQSLTSLTAGGNLFFRISRDSLVNTNLSNLLAVRFRLLSVGNMTFKAQSLRLFRESEFNFPSTAIDTKRNLLRRSVPEASSAATEPSTGQGLILFSGTRPRNISEVIRFNSGHNPVGNDNYFAFYTRYDPANTNAIRVELNARSTQSILTISEKTNGSSFSTLYTTPTLTNILTEETDYYLRIELDDNKVRASIFKAQGAFYGALVYTTDWRTVTRNVRGLVGYDFNPYNYDFSVDFIKSDFASFGTFQSSSFKSIKPLQGASIYPISSPPQDLSKQQYIESGDATVTDDPNFGNPAPSNKFVRNGSSFFGGWETQEFAFIGDPHHLTISGQLYPTTVLNRNFRVLLIDKYDTVAWISYLPNLKAGQWNQFSISVNSNIAPANYRFIFQETGFYADTFWVQDLELNHDTIAWKVSPNGGGAWYNFYNTVNKQYAGVNFDPLSYRETVLDAKPIAYYRLGDSNTTAVDLISGTNGVVGVGVVEGVFGAITDAVDKAMSFPGTVGVTVGDAPQFSFTNNKFAFEFWFKAADTSSNIAVLGKGGATYEYAIYSSAPGTLSFNTYDSGATGNPYPPLTWVYDTNWHHVVWQADGSRVKLFIDGDLLTSAARVGILNLSDTTAGFTIGAATIPTIGTRYMKGLLDEVAVYSAPISDDIIWNHYQTALETKTPLSLKIRADALSDTAWIEGYKIYPKYGLFGHLISGALLPPPVVVSGSSFVNQDLRIFGITGFVPTTRDIRITGLGSALPTTRDIRLIGQLTSSTTQDIRIFGATISSTTVDVRVTGTPTSIITQDLRTVGSLVSTITQDLRITGLLGSSTTLGIRITGAGSGTGSPMGLLAGLTYG